MFLCNRVTNKQPFLGNESVNTPTRIEEPLKAVFSAESNPWLYNEDLGQLKVIERVKWRYNRWTGRT
jgi:hypothetical protein